MAQRRMISRRLTGSDKVIFSLQGQDRARFIYAALMPHTDKAGRLNANPVTLKSTVFEAFEYTATEIADCLDQLAAAGLIVLYGTKRHPLILQVTKFDRFNTPDSKEPESEFPAEGAAGTARKGARTTLAEFSQKILGVGASEAPDDSGSPGGGQSESEGQAAPDVKRASTQSSQKIPISPAEDSPANLNSNLNYKGNIDPPPRAREAVSEPQPQGGEFLQELTNENCMDTLKRTAPGVWEAFDEIANLQRTDFGMRVAQAKALLKQVEARGAPAVEGSLRTILATAGDGGRLFSRAMAHLDKRKDLPPAEHTDDLSGADLLDLDVPLTGDWGAN